MGEQQSTPVERWESYSIDSNGRGSRFQQNGYTFPKPLIDVKGKPMIQLVVENLNIKKTMFTLYKKNIEKSIT